MMDPRVNLISRQDNGKWRAIETDIGAFMIHAEADSLADLIAGPDSVTLSIEQYGALVREREQAIREYERTRDALELAKQGDAGAIAKVAKEEALAMREEALAAVLAMREEAMYRCLNPAAAEYGVNSYFELIEAEMEKL